MQKLRVLDLFSGIGGFSLGLERTGGFETVAFCEIDPYCQRVLRKHWPRVPVFEDVRWVSGEKIHHLATHPGEGNWRPCDAPDCEVICGGFPCQDISNAGLRAGISGERSGLWREFARLIGELRPRYVIVENVAALLGRGLGVVLGDLAALGYDAEWHGIPASAVGARHIRDRVWIIAHPDNQRELQPQGCEQNERRRDHNRSEQNAAHADGPRLQKRFMHAGIPSEARRNDDGENPPPDPWWPTEPALVRRLHGIPNRVDRIAALGNAVVPQIPEIIGRAILEAEGRNSNHERR